MTNTTKDTLTVKCIGKLSEKSEKSSKTAILIDSKVKNVYLMQDIESGSVKGLQIGNKTIFTGEEEPKYGICAFHKKHIGSYFTKNFEYLCKKSDVKALQDIRVDKDYFSYEAVINPNNFDGNFYKVKNIQKIENDDILKKIRTPYINPTL